MVLQQGTPKKAVAKTQAVNPAPATGSAPAKHGPAPVPVPPPQKGTGVYGSGAPGPAAPAAKPLVVAEDVKNVMTVRARNLKDGAKLPLGPVEALLCGIREFKPKKGNASLHVRFLLQSCTSSAWDTFKNQRLEAHMSGDAATGLLRKLGKERIAHVIIRGATLVR
jgi:hypothetical protein